MSSKLKNVTLATIDGVDPNICTKLLRVCMGEIDFDQVKLISFEKPSESLDGIEYVEVEKFNHNIHQQGRGNNGYNEFIVNELYKFIDTDYVLIVQTDGFVHHPELWTNEFLDYDYIGAVWPDFILQGSQWLEPEVASGIPNLVGNGGFSLRSRKILELAAQCPKELIGPEDVYYCLNNYEYFISHGIKYAPIELANKFSKDDWGQVRHDCFGFHGNKDYIESCV
jgi:hypothetical protein